MYCIHVYVSPEALNPVKEAMFNAGGGAYGQFMRCAWETLGQGQYQEQGKELVIQAEYRLEMYCLPHCIQAVIQAMKQAHPCNEPLFELREVNMSLVDD